MTLVKRLNMQELLQCSISDLEHINQIVREEFGSLGDEILNKQPAKGMWSVTECIEHLNCYGRYYIPEIKKGISSAIKNPPGKKYTSGPIGEFFVSVLQPDKQQKIRLKSRTIKGYDPVIEGYVKEKVFETFQFQQHELIALARESIDLDLGKIKIRSSIGNIFRFKLGDVFRIIIAHEKRHVLQAQNTLKKIASISYF